MSKIVGTEKPEALRVILAKIPEALRIRPQWLGWRYVRDVDAETGEVSWDKPPVSLSLTGPGSSTDRRTWADWQSAIQCYGMGELYLDGLGFALAFEPGEDPHIVAIDLDLCRDPQTGIISEWAWAIIRRIDSYTEVSPSGRGIRIFLFGALPANGRKKGDYENYERGRYVTVTGQHVEGTSRTVEHRQEQLLAVHKEQFGEPAPQRERPAGTPSSIADLDTRELLERAFCSRNGSAIRALYGGDTSGYPSRSEADLALANHLAFWFRRDANRMMDAIRESGLFRAKWERDDYRERTLRKAIDGCQKVYEPGLGYTHTRNCADANGHHQANGASTPPPAQGTGKPHCPESFHLTDDGNAKRVVARHGHNLRHCWPFKESFVFNGKFWAQDKTAETTRMVKETRASLYRWAANGIQELGTVADDEEDRKKELASFVAVLKHCLAWESADKTAAALKLALSEPGIPVLPADLDRDPWLLNVQNGTVDLRTGTIREHLRDDLITKQARVNYEPHAKCPLWLQCLHQWMVDNEALVAYLQRAIGYSLTGDVSEQCLFFLHGEGANGKSTFLGTIKYLLGDYAYQSVPELLMAKNTESHPTERADLFGRRFICTIETDEGKRMAESLMKQLTGGDSITARKMRQDFFEFDMTGKIFLAANHKPQIRGTDHAVWRRIKLIPFTVTIADGQKDPKLTDKLKAERAGILAWAVRGCLDWQRDGLAEPDEVRAATDRYREEQDIVRQFIKDCCFVGNEVKCRASIMFAAYQQWSGDKAMTEPDFRKRMNTKGFESKKGTGNASFYHRIGLPAE
jgi:putative DNA primase/helicase